jgi:hypothetical protein
MGVAELHGERDTYLRLAKTLHEEYTSTFIPSSVQEYSDARRKEEATKAAHLLQEDETGYKRIDAPVSSKMKHMGSRHSFTIVHNPTRCQ